jgi:hypothetical protein
MQATDNHEIEIQTVSEVMNLFCGIIKALKARGYLHETCDQVQI